MVCIFLSNLPLISELFSYSTIRSPNSSPISIPHCSPISSPHNSPINRPHYFPVNSPHTSPNSSPHNSPNKSPHTSPVSSPPSPDHKFHEAVTLQVLTRMLCLLSCHSFTYLAPYFCCWEVLSMVARLWRYQNSSQDLSSNCLISIRYC
jgi:hypothetical protein